MNNIKRKVFGNYLFGAIVFFILIIDAQFGNNINDLLAIVLGILFLAGIFISLILILPKSNSSCTYQKAWICKGLRIFRLSCTVLMVIVGRIYRDRSTEILFTIIGITFILEGTYWNFILKNDKLNLPRP